MTTSTPRTRRARGSLTADAILEAAEHAAVGGIESMTVRTIAARLDASPMSLYRYFATRDDLLDALLDRVLGRFVAPPTTDDWVADLGAFAHAHRAVLVAHPWAVPALFTHPNPGPNTTRVGEVALGIVRRGGVTGTDAVVLFSAVLALNYGWSAFSTVRSRVPQDVLAATLAALPADVYPHTASVAAELAGYGSDAHYDEALATLLRGVATS
jgi:AcrR family transcriptional regulator